jgi:hypothetical protein
VNDTALISGGVSSAGTLLTVCELLGAVVSSMLPPLLHALSNEAKHTNARRSAIIFFITVILSHIQTTNQSYKTNIIIIEFAVSLVNTKALAPCIDNKKAETSHAHFCFLLGATKTIFLLT